MRILRSLFCFFFLAATLSVAQRQPDAKRVKEIAHALAEKNLTPTELHTWPEVQEACQRIAKAHGWQSSHAPDARLLILLGLGNKYSNPDVADGGTNHLDYQGVE